MHSGSQEGAVRHRKVKWRKGSGGCDKWQNERSAEDGKMSGTKKEVSVAYLH